MKVKLAVIPREQLAVILPLIEKLRDATNAGDMDGMDTATEALLALVHDQRSIDLSEDEWKGWFSGIRSKDPTFQSDYLVSGELFNQYFPDATAGTMILQLPFNEGEAHDV